jgi:DNA-binding phage protein
MYEAPGPDGQRAHTVTEIAAEFGVSRPTIYRDLKRPGPVTAAGQNR